MKEATLKQAGKVLDLIAQKEISCEQLQKLLESGLFADLLVANIDLMDRNTFRHALGLKPGNTYPLIIDYSRSVEDGIKAGNYDWVNNDIISKNFPSQEKGPSEVNIELIHFNKEMTTGQVLAELEKTGYRPATLKELLALGEKHPDPQREFPIIAPGSVWQDPNGCRHCPYLDGSGSEHRLVLHWIDCRWGSRCRFAAVRK